MALLSGLNCTLPPRRLADRERVVDVPPKLSARARVFATDAHSVGLVGTRMAGLRPLVNDLTAVRAGDWGTGLGRVTPFSALSGADGISDVPLMALELVTTTVAR
jgi:hypothetical protein